MSEILHGVLNMPPELWCNDEVSILQRHSCYLEASRLIKELEQRLAAAEADKKRLRGQLQHCVQQLNRANRDARDRNEYTDAIDSANRAIYEIFECPVKEQSGN